MSQTVQVDFIPPPLQPNPPSKAWVWQLVAVGIALFWLYHSILARLVGNWSTDPNYSHGYFVPVFALFVVWERRHRLLALPVRPAWSGLWLLAFGLAVLTAGVVGAELFLSRVSLLFVVGGLIALFLGWNYLRALIFPLAFLLLMIPLPQIVFNHITLPLQRLASISAAQVLQSLGVPVLRDGNIIHLVKKSLEVAQACSGIRSMTMLATLALIYGYLMETRTSIRVALALASIPIAVVANIFRIVVTALIVQYWDPAKADGLVHELSGLLVFVTSLVLLFIVHRAFNVFGRQGDVR